MRHLILALLTLTACTLTGEAEVRESSGVGQDLTVHTDSTSSPTLSGAGGDAHVGDDRGETARGRAAQPPLLPYGIGPTDPFENDPNANRACAWAAERVATWHQRRGIEAYCKKRSYYARRGAKEPKRWVDGSYLHAIDVPAGLKMWRRALKAGWIDPEACPLHSKNNALRMFTRGKWFDLSLYNSRHLATTITIPCWDPEMMDRTDVGALTVAARSAKACFKHYKSKCSEEHLRVWWKEWIP
jgi:hypothetical protein